MTTMPAQLTHAAMECAATNLLAVIANHAMMMMSVQTPMLALTTSVTLENAHILLWRASVCHAQRPPIALMGMPALLIPA